MRIVRRGVEGDREAVAAIQRASPEAAQWEPDGYTAYDFRVAVEDQSVAGFLVARRVAEGESELLNLAVEPRFRRRGIARELLRALRADNSDTLYLEVRESNETARKFYKSMGFREVSVRPGYYTSPAEAAIVMKLCSC